MGEVARPDSAEIHAIVAFSIQYKWPTSMNTTQFLAFFIQQGIKRHKD